MRRAAYRHERKVRLDDGLDSDLQAFKALRGLASDQEAIELIIKTYLRGAIGNLPANLLAVSAELAEEGVRVNL